MRLTTKLLVTLFGRSLLRSRERLFSVSRLFLICLLIVFLASSSPGSSAADSMVLVGMGSTVPMPLYQQWGVEFSKVHRNIEIKYVPLGTSEGIRQISKEVGDFGAGEVPLTPEERGKLTEVPVMLIGIVPIYNLPQVHEQLRFSGDLLAKIYLGRVKRWDAPEIARLNPTVSLPNMAISVVYRPAGKGTNYVFTDFLSKTSPQFRSQIGVSPSPSWPIGVAAGLSSTMVDAVKQTPGSIGYVEAQYAVGGHIQFGLVQNRAGNFVEASKESISAACKAMEVPQWDKFAISLTDTPGQDAYPITSFTWVYLRRSSVDPVRRRAVADFLNWILGEGQQLGAQLGYSVLPKELRENARTKVNEIH